MLKYSEGPMDARGKIEAARPENKLTRETNTKDNSSP